MLFTVDLTVKPAEADHNEVEMEEMESKKAATSLDYQVRYTLFVIGYFT